MLYFFLSIISPTKLPKDSIGKSADFTVGCGSSQVNGPERKIKVLMQHAKVVVHVRSRSQGLFHFARPPSVYFRALFASGIVPMERLCNHKIHRHTHWFICTFDTMQHLLCHYNIQTCESLVNCHELQTLAPTQQCYQHHSSSLHKTLPSKAGWFHTENCFTLKVFIAL